MKQTRQPSFKGSSRVVLPEVILLSSAGSCPLMHICMYIMCHAYMHDRRTYAEARARAHSTRVHPRSPWTTLAYKLPNFLANRRRRERERERPRSVGGSKESRRERSRGRGHAGKRKRHLLCRSNILRIRRNTSGEFPFRDAGCVATRGYPKAAELPSDRQTFRYAREDQHLCRRRSGFQDATAVCSRRNHR